VKWELQSRKSSGISNRLLTGSALMKQTPRTKPAPYAR